MLEESTCPPRGGWAFQAIRADSPGTRSYRQSKGMEERELQTLASALSSLTGTAAILCKASAPTPSSPEAPGPLGGCGPRQCLF